uniref:Reverse transcriptase domain-containing protein n=1 Tax=Solanum lycopersicum TaxID=4081 RepID=A0A3Q7IU90_SOLLC
MRDQFIVVYLDDIVVYSSTLQEHVEHLKKVFKVLRENQLYVKREKCDVACHHSIWKTDTVGRRRAWHAIIAFGLADTVRRHQASHAIVAFGLADTIGRRRAWHAIFALGQHRRSEGVGPQTVGRRREWHSVIALGQHKRSIIVGRAYTQRSVVAVPHRSWLAQHCSITRRNMRMFMTRHRRPLGLVGVLHGRLTTCVACPCYAVGRRQKHASDVCGATEAKAGGRQGCPVGLVGVLCGRLTAWMARLCFVVGLLQKQATDVCGETVLRRGNFSRLVYTSVWCGNSNSRRRTHGARKAMYGHRAVQRRRREPREELSIMFNSLPTLESALPKVGSSCWKSTARRVVYGALPADLENLETECRPRWVVLVTASGLQGKGSVQSGSVTSGKGFALRDGHVDPSPEPVVGLLELLSRRERVAACRIGDGQGESHCLIKTKHCDGPKGCLRNVISAQCSECQSEEIQPSAVNGRSNYDSLKKRRMCPPSACRPAVGAYGPHRHVSLAKSPQHKRRSDHLEVQFPWSSGMSAAKRHLPRPAEHGHGLQKTPLDNINGRTTLGVACHHHPWTAHTVGRHRAWHAISAHEHHTQSDDVRYGMTSSPLDCMHVQRRRAWHDITARGLRARLDDVGRGMTSPPLDSTHAYIVVLRWAWHDITTLGRHTRLNNVGHGMTSSPLDRTHGRMASAHKVGRHPALHDITALGKHTRSDYIGCGMTSLPLDSTHGRMTSGVARYYRLWAAHTVERRRAWHGNIAHGQQTRSNDIWRDMPSPPLDSIYGRTMSGATQTVERRRAWHEITAFGQHTRSIDVGCGMPSSPLCSTNGRTTTGVACLHYLWAAHKVQQRRAWHAITTFGQHKRSNDVGRGMPASPLGSTHDRNTSGMACHHRLWKYKRSNNIGRGMPSLPFGSTHGRTTSSVACHHGPWTAHTIERRQAWHDITAFGQHTRSNNVERDMPSPPLDSTHGRTTSGMACQHRLWVAQTVERRRAWHAIIAFGQHKRSNDVGHCMLS